MNKVTLRAATPGDAGFLYHLLKATMQEYVAQVWGWDEQWQQQHFQQNFAPGQEQLIIKDNEKIGVIATEKKGDALFLAKIYILPEYQGQGIGTQLIKAVVDEGFGCGLPVTLQVLKVNRSARRLYERLGFVVTGETATHYMMSTTSATPNNYIVL